MISKKIFFWISAALIIVCNGADGQVLSHPLTLTGSGSASYVPAPDVPDTLRALAIMVQFQSSTDSRITGDGRFDLSQPGERLLNPPPHDAGYFSNHLEFARRYYERVSGGRLIIEYTVWDQIFTMSEWMGAYSPRTRDDFTEIGLLFEEAWQTAAREAPGIPFENYDTYIIFHAGVGRDVDLTSIYGFDPSPLDIPSLYLGHAGLKRIFGDDYEGVEVGENGTRINNTMILPETQNRELDLITGRQVLQLGMNGLVCAMFGSRLGLPDLFNTDTGRSGIGRFGLMDGQAIFSFMGLFPPELSAWEKYFLGWIEPVDVSPGDHAFSLPAVALREPESILRVPINSREYYLVENRHRNPFETGQTLTLLQDGNVIELNYERDVEGFNALNISDISGVLLDVSVYDWSLPGGFSEARDEGDEDIFYDGGIVIWHIDERIINERIKDNRINAVPGNRGVRVVEADGSQDIGEEYGFLQTGQGSEDGTPFDYWYSGNPAPIYQNRFDAGTIPPAVSNTGAPANIAIYDFSERSPVMQLRVRVGTDLVSPVEGFPVPLNSITEGTSPVPFGEGILVIDNGRMKVVDKQGRITLVQGETDLVVTSTPAWRDFEGNFILVTKTGEQKITRWMIVYPLSDYTINGSFWPDETFDIGAEITAGPALLENGICIVGTAEGNIISINGTSVETLGRISGGDGVLDLHVFPGNVWAATGRSSVIAGNGSVTEERMFTTEIFMSTAYMENGIRRVSGIGAGGIQTVLINLGDVAIPVEDSYYSEIHESAGMEFNAGYPISVDIDKDGLMDIVFPSAGYINVLNRGGASLDYFPIRLDHADIYPVFPVSADTDGSGIPDIIFSYNDRMLLIKNSEGESAAGTPLAVGERVVGSPAVLESDGKVALALVTADNLLYLYRFSGNWNDSDIMWGEERFDGRRTNVQNQSLPRRPISNEFMPENRAYNWPNPVYEGVTNIRYYLSENADVNITIYSINGEKVTSFDGPGIGGIDNETEWNTSGVQSGIYLGRIEAKNSMNNNVVFIKIAVVK